jgi:hypothetical protein
MPKVYKVVKRVNGKLVSQTVSGEAQVQYKPGKWVYPPEWLREKGYGLFAFSNLQDAIDYYRCTYGTAYLQLWEAQAEKISPPPKTPLHIFSLQNGIIKNVPRYLSLSKGTICCEKLKLTKQVKGGYKCSGK